MWQSGHSLTERHPPTPTGRSYVTANADAGLTLANLGLSLALAVPIFSTVPGICLQRLDTDGRRAWVTACVLQYTEEKRWGTERNGELWRPAGPAGRKREARGAEI